MLTTIALICLLSGGLLLALRRVPVDQALLAERAGQPLAPISAAPAKLVPLLDQVRARVCLRERAQPVVVDVSTSDHAPITAEVIVRYRVQAPDRAAAALAEETDEHLASTVRAALRHVVATYKLSSLLHPGTDIADPLAYRLTPAFDAWGLRIAGVDVLALTPSTALQPALIAPVTALQEREVALIQAETERHLAMEAIKTRRQTLRGEAEIDQVVASNGAAVLGTPLEALRHDPDALFAHLLSRESPSGATHLIANALARTAKTLSETDRRHLIAAILPADGGQSPAGSQAIAAAAESPGSNAAPRRAPASEPTPAPPGHEANPPSTPRPTGGDE